MLRQRAILIVSLVHLFPVMAFAQATPPPREVTAELSFVGTSGNSSTQSIGVGTGIIQRFNPWEVTTKATYVRNRSDAVDATGAKVNVLKAESLAIVIGGARILNPRVSLFVRENYLRDHFAGIKNRSNPEAGASITAFDVMPQKLVVDVGVGYAKETRLAGSDLSTGTGTLGALYTFKLSDSADISDDIRSIFSFSDGEDRRYANVASLSAKLTTVFSLKLSNTVRFVNAPPPGFEKTDTITAIALVAKF